MSWELALKLVPLAVLILQGLWMWVSWSMSKKYVTTEVLERFKKDLAKDRAEMRSDLDDTIQGVETRQRSELDEVRDDVKAVKGDVDDLHERVAKTATHEDVAALSRATGEIAGDLKGLTATVAGLAQGVNAIAENVNMLLRHHVERART